MIDLSKLTTEMRNPNTMNLDEMTPLEIATAMNREDAHVIEGIHEVLPSIAQAITWATEGIKSGGRLIYMGAGTSGRLGVLDAAECPPTFGVSPDLVVGLIAGGEAAFTHAIEGAEDSPTLGVEDLKRIGLTANDVVVGLAASGRTPYVAYALDYAREVGSKTVAIACNKNSVIGQHAELAIEPVCGPEALTGSTRLKAGTAQKLVLNMISTGTMVGLGKVYQNLMVDVQPTNDKLVTRAQNICMAATECTREEAIEALAAADGHVKCAIVMLLNGQTAEEAHTALEAAGGRVRGALTA